MTSSESHIEKTKWIIKPFRINHVFFCFFWHVQSSINIIHWNWSNNISLPVVATLANLAAERNTPKPNNEQLKSARECEDETKKQINSCPHHLPLHFYLVLNHNLASRKRHASDTSKITIPMVSLFFLYRLLLLFLSPFWSTSCSSSCFLYNTHTHALESSRPH